MNNKNRGDLAGFGNTELDSKVSLVDLFVGIFKIVFFIIPITRKVLEFISGLFAKRIK